MPLRQGFYYNLKADLRRYAEVILKIGINLQPGEYLLISALTFQRDLVCALTEKAYHLGASFVDVVFQDESLMASQIQSAPVEALTTLPPGIKASYERLLEKKGAYLSLSGCEDPHLSKGLPPGRQTQLMLSRSKALEFFYQYLYQQKIKWCVASTASLKRACLVFPKHQPLQAYRLLWKNIFAICGLYTHDPLSFWQSKLRLIEERKKLLNQFKINKLFFQSPSCEFELELVENARWCGGLSYTDEGQSFLANLPTEEIFTVPCFTKVNGFLETTRPLLYKSLFINKVRLIFSEGILKQVDGSSGIEELKNLLAQEPRLARLGEIALLDQTTRLAQSNLLFYDLLYDENTSCHLALGAAYSECLEGSSNLTATERLAIGFNECPLHIDLMFGSSLLNVTAELKTGELKPLIVKGRFKI